MNITEESIVAFVHHLESEERSRNTVEKYLRDVRSFFAFAKNDSFKFQVLSFKNGDEKAGEQLTKEVVIAYKNHLIESGYAEQSINSMLCSVNAFLEFSGCSDCKVKLLKLQRDVFCDESRELTRAEYERLCTAALKKKNERLNLILQTICGTGIRVSELAFITAEAVRKGEAVVSLKGKTRTVLLVRDLQKKLLRYIKEQGIESGAVFVTKTGKPISRTNIWREMKALCKDAHVDPDKVFPHNLRHLFARIFYGLDKDIAKLADILGHSSIETTRIYIVTTVKEHRKRMERMKLIV